MTRRARRRDFRGGSISEFFNSIDVKLPFAMTAIPLLLERLQLTGALVTIDAIGTQTDIAERIVTGGGDYLLALKANRPVLHQEVVDFFTNPPAGMTEPGCHATDGDHGRIEERSHVVCHKVDWLFSDRRYADEPRFPIWR